LSVSLLKLIVLIAALAPFLPAATPVAGLPLAFEENRGQASDRAKFLARGAGYTLYLAAGESLLSLTRPGAKETALVRSKLVGANPQSRIEGTAALPGTSNYFRGNDPGDWITGIPTYAEVRYRQIYRGIDLVYYGRQGQLEYDFIVSPGASPGAIQLVVEGVTKARLDRNGDLSLASGSHHLRWRRPVAYQVVNGARKLVSASFAVRRGRWIGFRVPEYDPSLPLVIDPVLSYSAFHGGTNSETGRGLAVDSSGSVYVAGWTSSATLPGTAAGAQPKYGGADTDEWAPGDAFVAKLNPAGTALVYSTYLGGNATDFGMGIAVDSSGNAYVTGVARSRNFPTTTGALQATYQGSTSTARIMYKGGDAFVTKLNPTGSALVYSTFLGGESDDRGTAIAVDSAGNAYVTGTTLSRKFPVTAGAFQPTHGGDGGQPNLSWSGAPGIVIGDGFVAKLNAAGNALSFCTYLGGNKDDAPAAIAVDSSGAVYVAGATLSPNFPTSPGAYQTAFAGFGSPRPDVLRTGDAFVAKLRADGSALLSSTYLGGTYDDAIVGLAVDATGNVYVAGYTLSTNFPTTPGAYQTAYRGHSAAATNEVLFGDAFITKLNPGMSALVYSTYLGGSLNDSASGIAVDPGGNAFVAGGTLSTNFPVTPDAVQGTYGGTGGESGIQDVGDAFVAGLSADGKRLLYSTYLGGRDADIATAIVLDGDGSGYVTGASNSANFPVTAGAAQRVLGGGNYNNGYFAGDAFIAKFGNLYQPALTTVSAASFVPGGSAAPDFIAAGYGRNLALTVEVAPPGAALPTSLAGTTVSIKDSLGVDRLSALWFVSPNQINYLIDAATATGLATVTVLNQGRTLSTGTLQIDQVAPGLFTANSDGRGVPSANVIRVVHPAQGDAVVTYESPFQCGATPGSCVPKPIDCSADDVEIFLELYGTGIRGRSSLAAVTAKIGGADTTVLYAGPVGGMSGLDQVNLTVSRSLIGRGEVDVELRVDGKPANTVKVNIK
jgi:uncharacterized protein (TIGR03437 family)